MDTENKSSTGRVLPERQDSRVTIQERGRSLVVHKVLTAELRDIGSFQNSVNLAFFTLTFGLGVGFGANLILSHATMSDRQLWLFAMLAFVCGVLSLYFGVRAFFDRRNVQQKIDALEKEGTIS